MRYRRPSSCINRRTLLSGAVSLGASFMAGTALTGCTGTPSTTPAPIQRSPDMATPRATLLAYFSRAGENYY